jgi:acyl carrier protein
MNNIEAFILGQVRKKGKYDDADKGIMELLDSFEYIELMVEIKEKFGINLDLSKHADLVTVNGIMRQIKSMKDA